MPFQDIPQEITDHIFNSIAVVDLLAISLTSQHFHRSVEPILYSVFVVGSSSSILLAHRQKPSIVQGYAVLYTGKTALFVPNYTCNKIADMIV